MKWCVVTVVWCLLLPSLCVALTQVSVLKTTPSSVGSVAGTINPQSGQPLPVSSASTKITFRLTQEDGTNDPRLFYQNSLAFTSDFVDEHNTVHSMSCSLIKNDPVVVYSVELVEMFPLHVQTVEIPFTQELLIGSEVWAHPQNDVETFTGQAAGSNFSSSSSPSGRRLLQTGSTSLDLNELQNPNGYLGKSLNAQQFSATINTAKIVSSNTDALLKTVAIAQTAIVNQISTISVALNKAKTAVDQQVNTSIALQQSVNTAYQKFTQVYNQTAAALNKSLADAVETQKTGLQRTQQVYQATQTLLQQASDTINGIAGSGPNEAFYTSLINQLAVMSQTLINKVDYIQLENDNDYLTEQALCNDLQNIYGNVAERRTLGTLFKPDGAVKSALTANQLSLFVPNNVELPKLDNLDPFVFEIAYTWSTAFNFDGSVVYTDDLNPLRTSYFDYGLQLSLDTIQPTLTVDQSTAQASTDRVVRSRYLVGRGSGKLRQYLHYRRVTIYCSDRTIVGLQNNWLNLLQVQQLIGPQGCDPAAGTCVCWAYVRRQRCSVQAIPSINVNPTVVGNVHTTTQVPQSITEILSSNGQGSSCPNNEDQSLSSVPSWYDQTDDDGTKCTQTYGMSATGNAGCQLFTNITALNAELESMCSDTLNVLPSVSNGLDGKRYAYWQNTNPQRAQFVNSTRSACSTNNQLMLFSANKYGDTLPYSYYQAQRAAISGYVLASARTKEIKTYGFVPQMGKTNSHPYYPQGKYRNLDPSHYVSSDGTLPGDWVDPQHLFKADMMTYAAMSDTLIPRYRLRRQTLQQNITMSCLVDGVQTITQRAQDVVIQTKNAAGLAGYEPRDMNWVGYLDNMMIPALHPYSTFYDTHGVMINQTRFIIAAPDEAIGYGTPESRRNKINYIRCNKACCNARAVAIDPSMTCANLTQNYTSDILSLAQRAYASTNNLAIPVQQPAIDNLRFTSISMDEFLKSEQRTTFDPIGAADTASAYFMPLTFRSDSFLAAQGILNVQPGQSSYVPVYNAQGPVPLQCDLAWYKQKRLPLPLQCEFLETHSPIAHIDPQTGVFRGWDKQGFLEFAELFYETTFTMTIPGSSITIDTTVVPTCPQPADIALLASRTASPQVRVFNDRKYNISLYLYVDPSGSTGGSSQCLVQRLQSVAQPGESIVLTTPFASVCDKLNITLFTSVFGHVWSHPSVPTGPPASETPCWSWAGNVTQDLATIQQQQQLAQSRVQTGHAVGSSSSYATDSIASGLAQTTQIVSQPIATNEVTRISTLYYSTQTYASSMQTVVLNVLNNTFFRNGNIVPSQADVDAIKSRLNVARAISSNLQSLIASTATQTSAAYKTSANTSVADLDAARQAFSDTANSVIKNLTATASYLNQQIASAQDLMNRYKVASANLDQDLKTLSYQAAILNSIHDVYGDFPIALSNAGARFQYYPIVRSLWDSIESDFVSIGLGVFDVLTHPMEILDFLIGLVKAIIALAKSFLCIILSAVGLGFLCDGSFFVMLLIIVIVLACLIFCCCYGKPLYSMFCGGKNKRGNGGGAIFMNPISHPDDD